MDPVTLTALIAGLGGSGGVATIFVKAGSYKARLERAETDLASFKQELESFKAAQAQAEKDLRKELLDRLDKVEDKLDRLLLQFSNK